jgi:hypothetical protein
MIFPADYPLWADAIMETVASTAEAVGLRYLVICGTLLGWYRDDRYIAWDNDLDVGVFYEPERYDDFLLRLMMLEFETDIGSPWEAKHLWKHGILVDVAFLENNEFYQVPAILHHAGHAYNVPSPTELYLEWKYGPDWRTPKRQGEYEHQHG